MSIIAKTVVPLTKQLTGLVFNSDLRIISFTQTSINQRLFIIHAWPKHRRNLGDRIRTFLGHDSIALASEKTA